MSRRVHLVRVAPFVLVVAALSVPAARAAAPLDCAALAKLRMPELKLEIRKAERVPPGRPPAIPFAPPMDDVQLPAYCRVEGVLEPRTGRNGRPYAIGFALALPEQWNGRFLFQGGGGLNGTVAFPLGWVASGGRPALARGFAVVTTDSGHEGAVFDATFMEDQQATLNFLYQAIGKVNLAAREIIARRYGRGPAHAYYVGCSTGGREAMMMSQRYPEQFDGIVAGAPAMRTSYSNLALRWAHAAFREAAPPDAAGHRQASLALSEGDRALIVRALLEHCDALDGLADGQIFATRACRFDPSVLQCPGAKTDTCLTSAQVTAVRRAFEGPKDAHGDAVYPGYPYDSGIDVGGPGQLPGFLKAAPGPVEAPDGPAMMDVDAEALAAATPIAAVGDTAGWTNLASFTQHGGKLLLFHGMSDPWFSANDTIGYYERLAADNGGAAAVQGFSRLFLVPGMAHCGGGPALDRFDLLSAVVGWVEQGKAPDSVTATGPAFPGRSRPLCAYPKHAQYRGIGDAQSAGSFECRE